MELTAHDEGYRQCSLTVMDNIADPDIVFDKHGICNYAKEFFDEFRLNIPENVDEILLKTIEKIQAEGKGKPYDCLTGISGGVDSSYLIYKAKEWGLRPLIVHFDNGWNSEIAVANINQIIVKTGFQLYTIVVDWKEFRDIQLSYIKAGVVDLEVPTDHAIYATWYKLAKKFKIKYILSGNNFITESIMPPQWNFNKADSVNLLNIHKRFGNVPLKTFPIFKPLDQIVYNVIMNTEVVKPLNLINYKKAEAKEVLLREMGWNDYGGKHYESFYTKFYQAYILPQKFRIDKRKAHLSNLILAKEMTREEAIEELKLPLYSEAQLTADTDYFLKKMNMDKIYFENYLKSPRVEHSIYGTQKPLKEMYPFFKLLRPFYKLVKR